LYRNSVPRRLWWTLAPLLIVVGVAASALGTLVERPLLDLLGGLLPEWLVEPVATDAMGDHDTSVWVVTLTVYFVVNVLLGPVVEEMYFRGYLLPRMRRFGRWAPLLNTVLFSLYHFWSPAQLVSRIGGAAPYVYAVEQNRSIYLGIVIHVALNAISVATLPSSSSQTSVERHPLILRFAHPLLTPENRPQIHRRAGWFGSSTSEMISGNDLRSIQSRKG